MSDDVITRLACEIVAHQTGALNLKKPLDLLTVEAVKRAIMDLSVGARDPALVGFLYPKEVVRLLENRTAFSATWLEYCEFLVDPKPGERLQVNVELHFLVPKISDLRSRVITRVEPKEFQLSVSGDKKEDAAHFEEEILIGPKRKKRDKELPKIVLKVLLQLEPYKLKTGKQFLKVKFRVANESPLEHNPKLYEQRKSYRLSKAVFAVFAKFKVVGGEALTPDQVRYKLKRLGGEPLDVPLDVINTNLITSKLDSSMLIATPIVIYDRKKFDPVAGERGEERIFEERISQVLETAKDALEIAGRLYKYQVKAVNDFVDAFSSQKDRAIVSVVPTAFGKSALNAILSVLACCLEKKKGPKAFLFFPTRPLSIQQLGDLIKCAYTFRKRGIASLTVGLFMGKGPRGVPVEEALAPVRPEDAMEGEKIRLITRCPSCGSGPIEVKKPSKDRLVPVCSNCGHEMDYVYLTDRETQTFCPDIIVATPDKLVYELIRWETTHVLLGAPARVCPSCGRWNPEFLLQRANWSCKWCGHSLHGVEIVHAEPKFMAFDEFHLLSGMVGNMLSHFIRLIRLLQRKYIGERKPTIFSLTTATSGRPKEFAELFTGITEAGGDVKVLQGPDYFTEKEEVWQRILLLDPWDISTRGSISWEVITLKKAVSGLRAEGGDSEKYRQQLVYVQRKEEGHDLEEYIPLLAERMGIRGFTATFIHGDLSRGQLAERVAKLERGKVDCGIVTVIMAYGVHMPRLNVLHIFGSPNSTSEFFQVVGRTGREEAPALVLLHLFPGYPRDRWIRSNFIRWVLDPSFEPEPIEPANLSAVRGTSTSVLATYILSYAYEYMSWLAGRIAEGVIEEKLYSEALEEILTNVYLSIRGGALPKEVKQELWEAVQGAAERIFEASRDVIGPLARLLDGRRLLLTSLRGTEERVRYETIAPVGIIRMIYGIGEEAEGGE